METFDDLINEQLLNELGDGGVIDAIGSKISRKIGAIPDRIKAKVGSKAALGRLSLRKMIDDLTDEFKIYCGEQSLNVADSAVEDFIEFLRHRVGFNIGDEHFDGLAYGSMAKMQPDHRGDIEQAVNSAREAIDNGKGFQSELKFLAAFAKQRSGDAMLARKAIWQLARENPALLRQFEPVRDFIGRPLRAHFGEIVHKIAQVMLKIGKHSDLLSGGGDRRSSGRGATSGKPRKKISGLDPNEEIDAESLDVGLAQAINVPTLNSMKMAYRPFFEQLERYGFPETTFRDMAKAINDGATEEDLQKLLKRIRPFTKNNCVNLARIMFQCFRKPNQYILTADLFPKYVGARGFDRAIIDLLMLPIEDSGEKDAWGETVFVYDADEWNETLLRYVQTEEATEKLVVLLVGCVGRILS